MDNELIKLALNEIAEELGDSYEKPVSLALILGQIGATSRTFKDILIKTRVKLINDKNVDVHSMTIADFRSFFNDIDSNFEHSNDETHTELAVQVLYRRISRCQPKVNY